jgi:hypothetical protein
MTAVLVQSKGVVLMSVNAAALHRSPPQIQWRPVLTAWLLVLVAMVANGTFRELVIERFVAAAVAGIISATLGIIFIQLITRPFLRRLGAVSTAERFIIAGVWLAMTITFEFLFGHYVDGASWADLLADYNLAAGRLWPVVLASIAAAPFVWTTRRTA